MTDRQHSKKPPRQSSASKCDITIDGANYDLTNLVISGGSRSPAATAGVGGGRANNNSKPPPITVRRFSRRSSAISRNSLSRKTHHYPQLGQAGFNLFSSHHQTDFDADHHQAGGGGGGGCDDDDDGPPPAFSWGQYEEPSFAWEGQEEEEARQWAGGGGAGGRRGSVGRRRGSGGNMFALQNDNNNIMRQPHDAYFFGSNNNNDRIVPPPPPPTKPPTRRMSSMSSISMSIHTMDCPGLTELNESISSFSDHYELEEAMMMASNLQKEEDDCQEIEIEPGVYLPFRGSDETWDAIKAGRAVSARCFDCTIELVATNDCQYAICPQCHTVNPIDFGCAAGGGGGNNSTCGSTPKQQRGGVVHFGVVMGFKKEWCGDYHHLVQKQQYS